MRDSFFDLEDRTDELRADMEAYAGLTAKFLDRLDLPIVYHDFALDGVVLGFDEIKASVDSNIISDASLIPRYREIANFKETLEWLRSEAVASDGEITLDFVKAVHKSLYKDVAGANPGRYRKEEEIEGGYYHPVLDPARISYETRRLLSEAESDTARLLHPITLAAWFHYQFLQVAPFGEGSGRTARVIANFILMREGFLPAVIHASERHTYFEELANEEGDLTQLTMDAIVSTLEHGTKFLETEGHSLRPASSGSW
jgi:Fic family protein